MSKPFALCILGLTLIAASRVALGEPRGGESGSFQASNARRITLRVQTGTSEIRLRRDREQVPADAADTLRSGELDEPAPGPLTIGVLALRARDRIITSSDSKEVLLPGKSTTLPKRLRTESTEALPPGRSTNPPKRLREMLLPAAQDIF